MRNSMSNQPGMRQAANTPIPFINCNTYVFAYEEFEKHEKIKF